MSVGWADGTYSGWQERHDLAEKSHPGTALDEFRRDGFEF